MRKLITAMAATAAILIAGSIAWKAEAATVTGVASLPPLARTYSPVENVRCVCGPYRCVCGHPYYRRYGSGYPPYQPWPYGYYSYGYWPYGDGYRWRY